MANRLGRSSLGTPVGKSLFAKLALAGSLALAILSGVAAFEMSFARTMPQVAASLWPTNGWAKMREANAILVESAQAAGGEGQIPTEFDPAFDELSREALRHEPLAVAALRNVGLYASGSNGAGDARAILEQAANLSRRDPLLSLWLSQEYASAGQNAEAFRQYDILLRTNTRSQAATLPLLAAALSSEEAALSLYPLLAADPPWHQDFWAAVIQNGEVSSNAAKLRRRLHLGRSIATSSHDALILGQLINGRDVEGAFELYDAASRAGINDSTDLLRDPGFTRLPILTPFEWDVIEEKRYGATIDEGLQALRIIAEGGASGVVARQLVALNPGSYGVALETADQDRSGDEFGFGATITCADMLGARTFRQERPVTAGRAQFDIEGPCRHFWVALVLEDTPRGGGDIDIDQVSLRRLTPQ